MAPQTALILFAGWLVEQLRSVPPKRAIDTMEDHCHREFAFSFLNRGGVSGLVLPSRKVTRRKALKGAHEEHASGIRECST